MLKNLLIVVAVITASLGGYYIFNSQGSEKAKLVDSYNVTCNNKGDQPTDYYFYPAERFPAQPHLMNVFSGPGTIMPHRFSTEPTHYSIRPLHAQLVIPRNLLHSFHRRCMPWAKQYWDLVLIEALWPNMSGRTIDNEPFSGEEKSSDAIFLTIGNIHSETDHSYFRRKTNTGELIKASENKVPGLTEYKVSKNIGAASSTYLVDKNILTTYLGNEVIFSCHRPAVIGSPKKGLECTTRFVLPNYIWPKDHYSQKHLPKDYGLEVQYRFHRSHIGKWQEIHNAILTMLKGILVGANFDKSPNKWVVQDAAPLRALRPTP